MRRGEIWRYAPVTARPQPTLRLIVSADALIDADAAVLVALQVVEGDDPQSLLAPAVGGLGWAVTTHIERVLRSRLVERVGVASEQEMEQVAIALRAGLDI